MSSYMHPSGYPLTNDYPPPPPYSPYGIYAQPSYAHSSPSVAQSTTNHSSARDSHARLRSMRSIASFAPPPTAGGSTFCFSPSTTIAPSLVSYSGTRQYPTVSTAVSFASSPTIIPPGIGARSNFRDSDVSYSVASRSDARDSNVNYFSRSTPSLVSSTAGMSSVRGGTAPYLVATSNTSAMDDGPEPLIEPAALQTKTQRSYRNLRDSITLHPVFPKTYPTTGHRGNRYNSDATVFHGTMATMEEDEDEAENSKEMTLWGGIDPEVNDEYFGINDYVIIRRYAATNRSYSRWAVGKVVRPLLFENGHGQQERRYHVTYRVGFRGDLEPGPDDFNEADFSPMLDEIRPVPSSPPKNKDYLTASGGLDIRYDKGDSFAHLKPNCFIFAAVIEPKSFGIVDEVWAPAMCLEVIKGPNLGVSVKIIGGKYTDQISVVYKIQRYAA